MSFTHHFRCHKLMLENFFGMDASSWVQTHYLIEKIDELSVGDPLLATEVEAFLKMSHQVAKSRSE